MFSLPRITLDGNVSHKTYTDRVQGNSWLLLGEDVILVALPTSPGTEDGLAPVMEETVSIASLPAGDLVRVDIIMLTCYRWLGTRYAPEYQDFSAGLCTHVFLNYSYR